MARRWWRRREEREGLTAFVLSGGGNLGAIQVGMARALFEADVRPDLILGCSVGALNGAALAAEPTLAGVGRLDDLWRSVDGGELMPSSWLPRAVQLARKGGSIHSNDHLRSIIDKALPVETFDELELPFECVATDVDNAEEVWFSTGPLAPAILASAALPAVFPSVLIDGKRYLDGAIVNDVPVSRAVELGATTIFVLHVGNFDRPPPELKRPIDAAVAAYWIARKNRFKRDVAALPEGVTCRILPTGAPDLPTLEDFTQTAELVGHAYDATRAYLAGGATPSHAEEIDLRPAEHVASAHPGVAHDD